MPSSPDSESPTIRQRGLVQAPVAPLDADGVQVATLGTLVWIVAAVALKLNGNSTLWLWTCVIGAVLGLTGLAYCLSRRTHHRRG